MMRPRELRGRQRARLRMGSLTVVDDAIVVVENVERHMREGMSRMNAALVGARELIGPIIAMTITLAAVYTPIALQGGLTGALFREFALTLAGAVFISGVVALTLSPFVGMPDWGVAGVRTCTRHPQERGRSLQVVPAYTRREYP